MLLFTFDGNTCSSSFSLSLSLQAAGTERVHKRYVEATARKRLKLAEQSVDNLEKFLSSVVSTMLREEGYWNHGIIERVNPQRRDEINVLKKLADEWEQNNALHRDTYAERRARRL